MKDTEPKTVLVARCSNCAQWRHTPDIGGHVTASEVGYCGRGLFPPQGEPRCDQYEISHAFKQLVISTMMKEQGPMAMPVKLVGGRQSAKKLQKPRRR